ncbi:hypothetical protein LCGC14_2718210 [marine sediment metagenome]|uniref:Uncharacterized protein n=1 Tax=marine sediment metagenome TaxID=412755 RepID=A0A0F8ZB15_9ZZZZ
MLERELTLVVGRVGWSRRRQMRISFYFFGLSLTSSSFIAYIRWLGAVYVPIFKGRPLTFATQWLTLDKW